MLSISKYLLFFLVIPYFSLGQLNPNTLLPNVMPSNPKAYEFMKYGEIPVSKYTGIPDISIPIYAIKSKGLEIPIVLSYHSNGFKVSEEAGWTGLGWTLNCGGSITQIVSGTDDFGFYKSRLSPNLSAPLFNVPLSTFGTCSPFFTEGCASPSVGFGGCQVGSLANCAGQLSGYNDSEPDVFKFNMLGYSGSFVLDWQNENFICLSDSNIKIESDYLASNGASSQPNVFFITVPDGHRFRFELKEEGEYVQNYSYSKDHGNSFTQPDLRNAGERSFRTYQLTQIITNRSDVITFDYNVTNNIIGYPNISNQFYYIDTKNSELLYNFNPQFCSGWLQGDLTESVMLTKQKYSYLNAISVNNENIINFNVSDRLDIVGGKKLDRIIINGLKNIDFNYSYFIGHNMGTNLDSYLQQLNVTKTNEELSYRLKLSSVTESGEPPYQFEYNESLQFPKKNCLATDYWGYYNGFMTNTSTFPNFYSFNIYRDKTYLQRFQQNNKAPNFDYCKVGVLNKIIYPSRGSTQFDYEFNSFDNYVVPQSNQGTLENLNLSTIPYSISGLSSSKAVLIEGGNTIFDGSAELYTEGCYPQNPGAYLDSYVHLTHFKKEMIPIVKAVSGYQNYGLEYALNYLKNTNPTLYAQNIDIDGPILQKIANHPNNEQFSNLEYNLNEGIALFTVSGGCGVYGSGASSSSSGNVSHTSINLSYRDYKPLPFGDSYGAGLRIKSIRNYEDSNSNIIISNKVFEYQGGKLMTPVVYTKNSSYGDACLEVHPSGGCTSGNLIGEKYIYNSSTIIPLSTNASGNYVGYDIVTEKSIANNYFSGPIVPTNGKIVTTFSNSSDTVGIGDGISQSSQVTLPSIRSDIDNGMVINESTYDNINRKVQEINNTYKTPFSDKCVFGYRFAFKRNELLFETQCLSDKCSVYQVGGYPIKRKEKTVLINSDKLDYLDGVYYTGIPVVNSNKYDYDSHNQISKITQINSKGDLIEKYNLYPYDFPYDNTYMGMIDRNMLTPVIEARTNYNGNAISLEQTIYKGINTPNPNNYFQSTYAVDKIKYCKSGDYVDLEDVVSFHNYDQYSNPSEVSKRDGTRISYIWGYNGKYPIAKIENASQPTNDNATQGFTIIDSNLSQAAINKSNTGTEAELLSALSDLRHSLPNAMVTTCTYISLVGVSTITDPKGDITTYIYDSFGRLQSVNDKDGKIISEYEYNYKSQN